MLTCPACNRVFVALGADVASDVFCSCGGALETSPIRSGLYELASSQAFDDARTDRGARPAATTVTAASPLDNGYDRSHGYGPAHGGPTSPGDAPASIR